MSGPGYPCGRLRLSFSCWLAILLGSGRGPATAADCNGNGREDHQDLEAATSPDCNQNGNPDECDVRPVNFGLSAARPLIPGPLTWFTAADLDGDGDPDVATGRLQHGQVMAFWNDGRGVFGQATAHPVGDGFGFRFILARDLDGDGDQDLVTCGARRLSVLGNEGGRMLRLIQDLDPGMPHTKVDAGDLDGDGDLDLAVDVEFGVFWFFNEGGLQFSDPRLRLVGSNPAAVAIADLDGDGDQDVATANEFDNVSILLNDGAGEFATARNYAAGSLPRWIEAGDLDADGDQDLAVANLELAVTFLGNAGDASFLESVVQLPDVAAGLTNFLGVGDIDGDLDLDVTAEHGPNIAVLLNHGNGTFVVGTEAANVWTGPFLAVDLDGDGAAEVVAHNRENLDLVSLAREARALSADCDRDGVPDECEGDCNLNGIADDCDLRDGESEDCDANQAPDECDPDCDRNGVPDPCDVARGAPDCNGNGLPDSCDVSGRLEFVHGIEAALPDRSLDSTPLILDMTSGDVDADRDLDLLVATRRGIRLARNPGGGKFEAGVALDLGEIGLPSFIAMEDVTGDGAPDLLVTDTANQQLAVFENQGDGAFLPVTTLAVGSRLVRAAIADLDADGDLDAALLAADPARTVVFRNDGGAFRALDPLPLFADWPQWIVAAAIDADPHADLVVLLRDGLALFPGRGDGTFGPVRRLALAGDAGSVLAADLDRDLDLDLAAARQGEGAVAILLNGGRGDFEAPSSYSAGSRAARLAAADLDSDLDVDLLGYASDTSLALLLNDGAGRLQAVELPDRERGPAVSTHESVAAAADLDGDGDADIASAGTLDIFCPTCLVPTRSFLQLRENLSAPPRDPDRDRNGLPDSCEGRRFHRGDPGGDGRTDIADPIRLLAALFLGAPLPRCLESADADNDGAINVTDPVRILRYLFLGGPEPAPPGPPSRACGADPDPPGSPGDLGCEEYGPCG